MLVVSMIYHVGQVFSIELQYFAGLKLRSGLFTVDNLEQMFYCLKRLHGSR
jgi:hypothetical protein